MHVQKLRKLEYFLRHLPAHKFNFGTVVKQFSEDHQCGAVCCAIGWCPMLFPEVRWKLVNNPYLVQRRIFLQMRDEYGDWHNSGYLAVAIELFGIPIYDEARALFSPYAQYTVRDSLSTFLHNHASPIQVADRIAAYIEEVCAEEERNEEEVLSDKVRDVMHIL